MKEVQKYRINSHDEDAWGVVTASHVLRYMQETANLQLYHTHPTPAELKESGRAFILSKLVMSIYAALHGFEEIEVETWLAEAKGVSFTRNYRMKRDGATVAEATSVWALVDTEDKHLFRVTDVDVTSHADPEQSALDLPKRMRIPPDVPLTLVGERTIFYADVDSNRHMNNTNYPDMLCSFIPDMAGRRVLTARLNFISEAPLGCTLKVYTGEVDGVRYFRTLREDGRVNIEAEMILE